MHNSFITKDPVTGKKIVNAIVKDITGRKLAEKEVIESHRRYRLLFEDSPISLLEIDMGGIIEALEGLKTKGIGNLRKHFDDNPEEVKRMLANVRVVNVNIQTLALFKAKDKDEFIKRMSETFTAETLELFKNQVMAFAENKDVFEGEANMKMLDGELRYFAIRAVVTSAGSLSRKEVLISITDLTERRNAERQREALNNEIIKSNKRLEQLSLKDPHTGLFNHRYLSDAVEAEYYRAKRFGHPLSVIMLDIDYFKSVNDVYGHAFGDMVLAQFAKQLKGLVRRYDIVGRFGGEEFLIISPIVNRSRGMILAQRLLDAMNLYNFGNKKHNVKLKLSLAVTSYPDDIVASGADLISLADKILNKAKEEGGNRVYSSESLKKIKTASPDEHGGKAAEVKSLKEKIMKLTKRGNQSVIEAIFAFAKTIEVKDHYTGEHVEKTVYYATEIAKALDISREETEHIKQAAALHDLGKIGISEKILLKPTKLTKDEFEQVKKHPQIGADIIRPIHFLHDIIPLMLYHHEWWDGKGYPVGLKGEEIPIGARIIAIADAYHALTSDRPYRKAYQKKEAVNIIKEGSGTQFEPNLVNILIKIIKSEK